MKNFEGVEIEVGDFVVGGQGKDADFGRVAKVEADRAWINWQDSGESTWIGGSEVEVYNTFDGAKEEFQRRATTLTEKLPRDAYKIQSRIAGQTPWSTDDAATYSSYALAEHEMTRLEQDQPKNDDGVPVQYRVIETE